MTHSSPLNTEVDSTASLAPRQAPSTIPTAPELSIVMPCLNGADTLGTCIERARQALRESGIDGEVIIADNGSSDGSQEIAARLGARLVPVKAKGYGNALMDGIHAACGKFIIMGDADDSYDFLEAPKILAKLREGYDLVQGCRLPWGGGAVKPGAMPFLHRWWGNPMFAEFEHGFAHPYTTSIAGYAVSPGHFTNS
ncbi:MAG: glycosyltransferase family 2 protein [Candidatus Acidiferrum sp.]